MPNVQLVINAMGLLNNLLIPKYNPQQHCECIHKQQSQMDTFIRMPKMIDMMMAYIKFMPGSFIQAFSNGKSIQKQLSHIGPPSSLSKGMPNNLKKRMSEITHSIPIKNKIRYNLLLFCVIVCVFGFHCFQINILSKVLYKSGMNNNVIV